ncbi:phage holin family protein [Actinomadura miaoliensis]|uniref:Phage holin family protein n=1 Tax=Actinomadura miaoliensis TaxID=430685 RepID=A0ABP7V271_9ACTN
MVSVRGDQRPGHRPADVSLDGASADASAGELVAQAGRQIGELVRQEMELARVEMAGKARNAGKSAGLFGGAGAVAFYGGAALVGAAVAGLAVVWPVWAAALVVGVVLLALAGVLALTGRNRLDRATPPAPAAAAASVREDVHEIKDHLHRRHSR